MGSSSSSNKKRKNNDSDYSSETIQKNIRSIKRLNPNEDIIIPKEHEDRNTKKLKELNENDEFDIDHPEYHEYMFFSMKQDDLDKKTNKNLDVLLKKNKKKKKEKQIYTFTKEENTRINNELAQILHIQYDLDKPKYAYSIKKLKCDPPPVNNDYLVIEYNMNRDINEKSENEEEEEEKENEENEKSDDKNRNVINKKYVITSRVVHTNNKNCKISNYVYTQQNGERYDYLDMNKDTDQVRKLNIKKDEDDEEKRVKEKEENKDRFINKQKKGEFRCKKMI